MPSINSFSAVRQLLRAGLFLSCIFLNSASAQNLCVARLSPLLTIVGTFTAYNVNVTVPDQTLCPWSGAAAPPPVFPFRLQRISLAIRQLYLTRFHLWRRWEDRV